METKPLLYGLIGFLLGGLLVSIAATTFDKPSTPANEEMTMGQMTKRLKNLDGHEFDKAFLSNMIAHHQAAVDMARLADSRAKHQEVKDLSISIVLAQEKEIDTMKRWQTDWHYTANHSVH